MDTDWKASFVSVVRSSETFSFHGFEENCVGSKAVVAEDEREERSRESENQLLLEALVHEEKEWERFRRKTKSRESMRLISL